MSGGVVNGANAVALPCHPGGPGLAGAALLPRVLGWDVLRGLCALMVASYHLLSWQGLAEPHAWGSYGVYLFFTLSGASLAYSYGDGLRSGRQWGGFLVLRWLRLAPLHTLACGLFLGLLLAHGVAVTHIPERLALNLSFVFGLLDPAVTALAVGGWSLGIEFVYYLGFPLLMAALAREGWRSAALAAAVLLQAIWLLGTVAGPLGYAAMATRYHQVPAFVGYFVLGCWIGWRQRAAPPPGTPLAAGLALWLGLAVLLWALAGTAQGDELRGWRGLLLPLACVAAVAASGRVALHRRSGWPQALGDATYGLYLLHPLLFWGTAWLLLPGLGAAPVHALATPLRLGLALGVVCVAGGLALASERWLEQPIRRWGRRWVHRAG